MGSIEGEETLAVSSRPVEATGVSLVKGAPVAISPTTDLLSWLSERCQKNLTANKEAQEYLRNNGITSEQVLKAYRVGIGDAGILEELGKEKLAALGLAPTRGENRLRPNGIIIPTCNPNNPNAPVGLIKICYGQSKHAFITKQQEGIACAADINNHQRIIITDTPFLALRLAQLDCTGVIIAEAPLVLEPLKDWLKDKELVVCTYKRSGLDALTEALKPLPNTAVQVMPEIWRSVHASLRVLGLQRSKIRNITVPEPVTAFLLKDLVAYGRGRVAVGAGTEALKALGADDPQLVEVYQVGYLPADFRATLQQDNRQSLKGEKIANSVIVPAFDEAGGIVDACTVNPIPKSYSAHSLAEKMAGLLAPKISTCFEDLYVTDSFRCMALLFKQGKQNTLLLRGLQDAELNAERLAKTIRTVQLVVRRNADEIAATLTQAGIGVRRLTFPNLKNEACELKAAVVMPNEPVAQQTTLPKDPVAQKDAAAEPDYSTVKLVSHDEKTEHATFTAGDITYTVSIDPERGSKLEVKVERQGNTQLDTFDFASEPQRFRFAKIAALRIQVPFENLESHFIAIIEQVRKLHDRLLNSDAPKSNIIMSGAEKQEALDYLKRPNLLDTIAADLDRLGWVGEDKSKRLLYLIGTSRKLSKPLSSALLASSGAGKSKCLETIAELCPPEDVIHVSRLTDSALYYHSRDALRNKLIVIDEADALNNEVMVALRVLQSRGVLSQSFVTRDPSSNQTTSHYLEARGPIAILTSSAGEIEAQMLSRCYQIQIDETPQQTQKILEAQRQQRSDPECAGLESVRMKILALHRNLQRLLEAKPIIIPFANRIEFPVSNIKHRRAQERFLNLVEASALLHQYQRLKQKNKSGEEFIIASEQDFNIALNLAQQSINSECDELTPPARELLEAVLAAKLITFDINSLKPLLPSWNRYRLRSAVGELVKLEIFASTTYRTCPRKYRLVSAFHPAPLPVVRLIEPERVGELAKAEKSVFANLNKTAAIG